MEKKLKLSTGELSIAIIALEYFARVNLEFGRASNDLDAFDRADRACDLAEKLIEKRSGK